MAQELNVNGRNRKLDGDGDMPLLWALRDLLHLTGAKYGCGIGLCGACTVHVNGEAVRACMMQLGDVPPGSRITTIEGLGTPDKPHPLQTAWIVEQVPQCGFCQTGMIMAAAALLKETPKPSESEIGGAISNICRCGTYSRVVKAIQRAAGQLSKA
ncbi:(2Fe-2S)-binding protein [Sphingobium boeckii]|uniref:Isoquinoline 1-oxidoreductase alpha subunit n=1 Tax=Sphingobium boeckii TaxID=1082345 RepID=A0A7W9AGA8_9SPHN|nr:(2Fe-2S)-binding protein [Sphingobium boeckii]MBB5684931.1 isoquinoline 1-oxidoreductase alpha subunit [Sphingobium boeckii]